MTTTQYSEIYKVSERTIKRWQAAGVDLRLARNVINHLAGNHSCPEQIYEHVAMLADWQDDQNRLAWERRDRASGRACQG